MRAAAMLSTFQSASNSLRSSHHPPLASAKIVIELLVEVHREIGATLVVVTHDPAIAAHLARIVHLETPAWTPAPSHAG